MGQTAIERLTGPQDTFSVFLEVQISGKDNLYGNFTGVVPLREWDQEFAGEKWENHERGLARGSGNNPYPRRTVFNIAIPTNVDPTLIEYTFNGVWRP
ncbi:histidine permease [Colletotrichum tabaci]|uniref:Histidine permease n=1 Tax=Colletotrichum tabaci TaxID=1209068 RepID=A0AAV9SYC7_9PEZI